MASASVLGRAAFERWSWGEAREELAACDDLDVDDLERLAIACHLVGADDESVDAWERAHLLVVDTDHDRAATFASWLGLTFLLRGEVAHAGGWLARGEQLVEQHDGEASARGLLLVPRFMQALGGDDVERSAGLAAEILAIGRGSGDADVVAFGLLCSGEAALAQGDVAGAMRRFDEVMLAVTPGAVSPITTGITYCAVIEACIKAFDLRRAAEWTDTLAGWCDAQPDLVPFRGQCLVHRCQVLQARGEWRAAVAEAGRARARLSDPFHPALGLACYQEAELCRLRGELDAAERAYRAAGEHGREPAPGLALLRLAQGDVGAARAAIDRMLAERSNPLSRAELLPAAVEIRIAAGDVAAAARAASELDTVAAALGMPLLAAAAARAAGSVALEGGDPPVALRWLRASCEQYQELRMPYEVACTRVELARACALLGDGASASLELELARTAFQSLGVERDLTLRTAAVQRRPRRDDRLTGREQEVLQLVATGMTNRDIAGTLIISEHTVARHLQNIFAKLGVSSRTAAAAYAFEERLA
jgi:ATP/maltotriose-dependent transcriptional regulator MalT